MTEVLIVSPYGFANRYREGKRPNDLLLASVIPVITEVGLPFIMYGDFNEPVHKLASFQFFKDLGAVEAVQWYQSKFGVLLPATCGGSTRNDSAIFHPDIAEWIEDMQVLPEHQIDMHAPLFTQLSLEKMNIVKHMWKLPKTWAPFAPSKEAIAEVYEHVDFQNLFNKEVDFYAQELEQALQVWSKHVETAVNKAIALEHKCDPITQPISSLHSSYRGRCNFQKTYKLNRSTPSSLIAMGVICHRLRFRPYAADWKSDRLGDWRPSADDINRWALMRLVFLGILLSWKMPMLNGAVSLPQRVMEVLGKTGSYPMMWYLR